MPRYFFHVSHPSPQHDSVGSEFADISAARAAAVQFCGEVIREFNGGFWDTPFWQLRVNDHEQRLLFTLTFSADDRLAPSQA
jgi:hypothetical protein